MLSIHCPPSYIKTVPCFCFLCFCQHKMSLKWVSTQPSNYYWSASLRSKETNISFFLCFLYSKMFRVFFSIWCCVSVKQPHKQVWVFCSRSIEMWLIVKNELILTSLSTIFIPQCWFWKKKNRKNAQLPKDKSHRFGELLSGKVYEDICMLSGIFFIVG